MRDIMRTKHSQRTGDSTSHKFKTIIRKERDEEGKKSVQLWKRAITNRM